MKTKIETKYIPLDKYWTIRMGVLDMIHSYDDMNKFLSTQKNLGGDVLAVKKASAAWKTNKAVDVGECGTLYRYLQFISWKLNLNKKFVKRGTLVHRKMTSNPEIVNWDLKKLLTLDAGTSQWASAAILSGNKEKIKNPPFFIKKTIDALKHWKAMRNKDKRWEPRYDELLMKQAQYFIGSLNGKKSKFFPNNPDDYCFARAFGIVDRAYGEKHWPMIRHHESNRLEEMEKALDQAEKGQAVTSTDHRVVQALAMLYKIKGRKIKFKYPKSVNKTWPKFWEFLKYSVNL
ncbi:MAG: hypothetical protein NUV54_00660 [Candidatus Taylorbacteria bacterium]|nr:hypothetical protein [Candidatus Taylorbacteria bacterium]